MSLPTLLTGLSAALVEARQALLALKADIAAERFLRALRHYALDQSALREKTSFRVDQPRIPHGQPGAGQWTDGGSPNVVPVAKKPSVPRKPKVGLSGKETAKDVPSWARGEAPQVGEDGKAFAKRLLDKKYGVGGYKTGPGSEFNQIQKYGDRAFE